MTEKIELSVKEMSSSLHHDQNGRYCNHKVGVVRLERRVDWFVAYAWVSK